MDSLPTSPLGWIETISIITIGIFAVISLFDKTLNNRRRNIQETDNALIESLQASVNHMKGRQTEMEVDLKQANEKITTLQAENTLLKDIAIGRDGNTKQFQTDAYDAMKKVIENVTISKMNHEAIVKMDKNIEKLASSIENLVKKMPDAVKN